MAGTHRITDDSPPPADDNREDTPMPAVLDPPLPETMSSAADTVAGTPADLPDVDAQIRFELEFLTSLVWAPDTEAAVHAIVGDYTHRAATGTQPADRIPLNHLHRLFLSAPNAAVFAAVTDLVDEGSPVTPSLLSVRIGHSNRIVRSVLLEIASPSGHGPLPGGIDVPHMARALINSYHRRGYIALKQHLELALTEAGDDELDGHWEQLNEHKQTAKRRRLAVTDALAAL